MFHFAPRRQSFTCDPLHCPTSSPYDAYDSRRSYLEQLALAQRQQERRAAEEALLRRRQQELSIDKEVERRRIAAYQAALEQHIADELRVEEECQWRAHQQAALREQQRRQTLEEEHRRKVLAARQQEELLRRRQEQARRQQIAERDQQQAQEDAESLEAHLQPFLQLLFGSQPTPRPTTATPAEPQAKSTTTAAEPSPAPLPAPSSAPAPPAQESTVDTTITSAAEKLQRHYRTHLHRRQALSTLTSLACSLDAQQSVFTLPSTLTFQPSTPSSTADGQSSTPTPTPKLAFQSSNAPFLAYEDFLVSLLSKADAASSEGDRTIKQARKQLVKRVNAELNRLDEARETAWGKEQRSKVDGKAQVGVAFPVEKQNVDDLDDLPPLLDSALPSAVPAEPTPSLPPVDDSITSLHTSDDASTPLTLTTLASVPSSPSLAEPSSTPRPESAASSDPDSHDTLSVDDSDTEAAINEIGRQAHKLGEEVVILEKVELGLEEAEDVAEEFVVL